MSKFLSYEERLHIEAGLRESQSFGAISASIGKHRTTISKEVLKYTIRKKSGCNGYSFNNCKNRYNCKVRKICGKSGCRRVSTVYCKICGTCMEHCSNYLEEICIHYQKPPYVCNGCAQLSRCSLEKLIYDAADAHIAFSRNISEARSGILTNELELQRLNELISPLIRNGQSIHQIYTYHADEIMCSERTLYHYIDASLFDIRNIDLPLKVKYRLHYKKPEFKVDRGCRIGRNYLDFRSFLEQHPDKAVVQMDSVIGSRGRKVLLTIHFVESSFMMAFLRDANTAKSVSDIYEWLYNVLGMEGFQTLFPVILTDNGSEFSNPQAIEFTSEGEQRTHIFYCDPSAPYQKGAIEVNHELVRRILPKGRSFDELTQADINLVMNHVNSYARKKLNDKTPYQTFSFYYGEETLIKLGYHAVAADDIILKPKLLKK